MAGPFIDANPAVSSEWPRWDEDGDGDLEAQVEFARAAQFGVDEFFGAPAYRFLVAPGDRYGGSTGLRCLARFWPKPREGDRDAFHHEFGFPPGTVFPDTWVVIWEAHGPGGAVAPVRLVVRPGGKLMLSFNSGTLNASGGGSGWTPERQVATIQAGTRYVLRGEITWDPDSGEGEISLKLNGQEIVPAEWSKHGTAQEVGGQPFLQPYVLVGLYTGTDLPQTLTVYVPRSIWADSLAECDAALNPPTTPDPVPPPVDPCAIVRLALAAEQVRSVCLTEELDTVRETVAARDATIMEIRDALRLEIEELRKTLSWAKVKKRAVWAAYRLAGGQ